MTRPRRQTDAVAVYFHPTEEDIGLYEIDRLHRSEGRLRIGYHYVVRLDGEVEAGRPDHLVGIFARELNDRCIGVLVIGQKFNEEQRESFEDLMEVLRVKYGKALPVAIQDT